TRLLQQRGGLTQQRAILPRPVGHGRDERLAEHLVGDLAAERLEQRELLGSGLADRHHGGILKHGGGALVGPGHDGLFGPFEVEGANESLAQALVLEFVATRIQEPTLRTGGCLVANDILFHASVAERRKIVARGPNARGELLAEEIALAGEALERHVAVAV